MFSVVFAFGVFLAVRPAFTTEPPPLESTQTAPAPERSASEEPGVEEPEQTKTTVIGGPTMDNYYPVLNFGASFPGTTCAIFGAERADRPLVIDSVTVSPGGEWRLHDCGSASTPPGSYNQDGIETIGIAPCQAGLTIEPSSASDVRNGCWIGVETTGGAPAQGLLTLSARWQCGAGETCRAKQRHFRLTSQGTGEPGPTEDPTRTPDEPTGEPTAEPTAEPTEEPSSRPTEEPLDEPTQIPGAEETPAS